MPCFSLTHGKYVERGSSGFCSRCIWYLNIRIGLRYLEHLQCRPSQRHCSVFGPYGMDPFQSLLPKVTASYSIYVPRMLSWNYILWKRLLIQSFLQTLQWKSILTVANYMLQGFIATWKPNLCILHMQLQLLHDALAVMIFSMFFSPRSKRRLSGHMWKCWEISYHQVQWEVDGCLRHLLSH